MRSTAGSRLASRRVGELFERRPSVHLHKSRACVGGYHGNFSLQQDTNPQPFFPFSLYEAVTVKMVVLSRSPSVPSTRRLVDVARARGHRVKVLNPLSVSVRLGRKNAQLLYRQKRVVTPDVVIPRIASSISTFGFSVLDQFAALGSLTVNSAQSIRASRDASQCVQVLVAAGLAVPATILSREMGDLEFLVNEVGGFPVLVKLLQGHERRGVMVCESHESLEAALEAVFDLGHDIILQEYVRRGHRDVRVFVVGGKALAAVCRIPRAGKLSGSLSRFARIEACSLTEVLRSVAEAAAKAFSLEVCAVDLLETQSSQKGDGARVLELHAAPSIAEMEKNTGVDLASAVIDRAEALWVARTP